MKNNKNIIAGLMVVIFLTSFIFPKITVISESDTNFALQASVTASSQYPGGGYNGENAKSLSDGLEWASYGEAKPWILYEWSTPITVGTIYIKGRNSAESPVIGKVTLSDGTNTYEYTIDTITYGASAPITMFPLDTQIKNITSMKFETVESTGGNVGLSGLEVISDIKQLDTTTINRALKSNVTTSTAYPGGSYDGKFAKTLDDGMDWASYGETKPWIQYDFSTPIDVGTILVKGRACGEYPTKAKITIINQSFTQTFILSNITYKSSEIASELALPEMITGVTSIKLETLESVGSNVGLSGFEVYSRLKTIISENIWSSTLDLTNYDTTVLLETSKTKIESPIDGEILNITPKSDKGLGAWAYITGNKTIDFTSNINSAKLRFFAKASENSGFGFALTNQNGNSYDTQNFEVTTQWKEFVIPLSEFVKNSPIGDEVNNSKIKEIRLIDNGGLGENIQLSITPVEIWSGIPSVPITPPATAEKVYESNFVEGPYGSYTGDGKVTWGITSVEKYLFKKAYLVNINEDGWLGKDQKGIALVDYSGAGHKVIRNIKDLTNYGKVRFYAKSSKNATFEYSVLSENQDNQGKTKLLELTNQWQEFVFSIKDLVVSSSSSSNLDSIKYNIFRDINGTLLKNDKLYISMIEVWTKTPPALEMPIEQPSTSPYDETLKTSKIWSSGTQIRASWNNESLMQSIITESIGGFKDTTIKYIKNPDHPDYFLKTGRGILFLNEIEDKNFDFSSGFLDETNVLQYQNTGTVRFFIKVPRAGMKFTVSLCNGNLLDENGKLLASSWQQGSVTVTVPKANEYVEMQIKLSDFIESNKNVEWTRVLGFVVDGVVGQKEGDNDAVNIGDEFYIRQPEMWTDSPKAFGVLEVVTEKIASGANLKDSIISEIPTIKITDMLKDRYQGYFSFAATKNSIITPTDSEDIKINIIAIDSAGIKGATKVITLTNKDQYKVSVCELVGKLDLSKVSKISFESVGGDVILGDIYFSNGFLREAQVIKKPNTGGSFGSGDFVFGWDDEFDWDSEFGWEMPDPEYIYMPKMELVKKLINGENIDNQRPSNAPTPTVTTKPIPTKAPLNTNDIETGENEKNKMVVVIVIVIAGVLITLCAVSIYIINRRKIK